jgi:biopolymer transport protein ExbD
MSAVASLFVRQWRLDIMNMRYFEARKARVEIIPMIDVMLFLLVFFIIVTLQMIPDAGIPMQLPNSTQTQHLKHPKFTVNILDDGSIKVKTQVLTPSQLTALFRGDGNPAKTEVTIAASKKVAFQHFVTVMDAARKAGVTDIGIAAQPVAAASGGSAAAGSSAPAASASGN